MELFPAEASNGKFARTVQTQMEGPTMRSLFCLYIFFSAIEGNVF